MVASVSATERADVEAQLARLRRIEGQVRGVHRMVEEGRPCYEIVAQLRAVAAGAERVADLLIEAHLASLLADLLPPPAAGRVLQEVSRGLRAR